MDYAQEQFESPSFTVDFTEKWSECLCWLTSKTNGIGVPSNEPLPWDSRLIDIVTKPISNERDLEIPLFLADCSELTYYEEDSTVLAENPVTIKANELIKEYEEVSRKINSSFHTVPPQLPIPELPLASIPPTSIPPITTKRTKRPYKKRAPRQANILAVTK